MPDRTVLGRGKSVCTVYYQMWWGMVMRGGVGNWCVRVRGCNCWMWCMSGDQMCSPLWTDLFKPTKLADSLHHRFLHMGLNQLSAVANISVPIKHMAPLHHGISDLNNQSLLPPLGLIEVATDIVLAPHVVSHIQP